MNKTYDYYYSKKEEYLSYISKRLNPHRLLHSKNVAKAAVYLSKKYGCDQKAAYIAGLLHDATKCESDLWQLKLFSDNGIILNCVEQNNPKLWHAMSAPIVLKSLGIEDEQILSAVRFHTTGKAGMSLLEKVIYIADYISEERDYPDVDVMRKKAEISLDDAALYSLKYTLSALSSKNLPIHPDSLNFYNELIINAKEGINEQP